MIKLLLTVRLSRKSRVPGLPYSEVNRPILWAVCPSIGETFWVSKTTDYFFDVARVVHWPTGDQIEAVFETDNIDDLTGLLEEENGGWLSGDDPGNWSKIVWPKPFEHPTATT